MKNYRHSLMWSLCLLALLFSGCRKSGDPMDDIKISIDLNIFKTFVSFRFADAQTGELIGSSDGTIVSLVFSGRDAAAVVSQTGEQPAQHTSVLGMVSVALDPYGRYEMKPGSSVIFDFLATAPGYTPTRASLTITKTGTLVCIVNMRESGSSQSGPQVYRVKPGDIVGGTLLAGFRMMTPGNLFELDCPDSVQFAGTGGTPASGRLTIIATRYGKLSETVAGGTRVMDFSDQGVTTAGVLHPESILDISLESAGAGAITNLPGKPVSWRFTVSSDYQPGDSLPVWSYFPSEKLWKSEGYAEVSIEDTSRFATFALRHFSLYASGQVAPTRSVSGEITFSFEKPFPTLSFPGIITLVDAVSGEIIQTVGVTLYSGLSLPLALDLPIGSAISMTVQATEADFELATQPTSLLIAPDQTSFSTSFTLIPLKCRFSGTVTAHFPADFRGYPVPAQIRVTDAESGNLLSAKSIQITAADFSSSVSIMAREGRAVNIRIIPVALDSDFRCSQEQITEESPCMENGSWSFNLESTTCRIHSLISVNIAGPLQHEPIPAELILLRASDRRRIKSMVVNLNPGGTTIDLESAVPMNTDVVILLGPALAERPFTTDPGEFTWANPCSNSQNPVFTITPRFALLTGKIVFTYEAGLVADDIPIRVLIYTLKDDKLVSSNDYLVHRADPNIVIRQFTPAEPLYLKITRVSNQVGFNPVPFKIQIPDPSSTPESWSVNLNPTEFCLVHFLVKVVCPKGEVLPTVQGYYRIPGDEWHEMNIVSGNLSINIELGLTYEVGMILNGVMIDSVFTVDKRDISLTFDLEPSDCEKMGWGK